MPSPSALGDGARSSGTRLCHTYSDRSGDHRSRVGEGGQGQRAVSQRFSTGTARHHSAEAPTTHGGTRTGVSRNAHPCSATVGGRGEDCRLSSSRKEEIPERFIYV